MTDRMALLVAIVADFNRQLGELGMEHAGIVYDPSVKRTDGKLEFYAIQNICNARADLLLEGYIAVREDCESHQVEDFIHVRETKGVSPA